MKQQNNNLDIARIEQKGYRTYVQRGFRTILNS